MYTKIILTSNVKDYNIMNTNKKKILQVIIWNRNSSGSNVGGREMTFQIMNLEK